MNEQLISMLGKVGVSAEFVEERTGEFDIALTAAQYEKLVEVLPDTKLLGIKSKKVRACVLIASLETAVQNHVKAPRVAGGSAVEISTVTYYTVNAPEAVNIVTEAAWDGERGYITVNGVKHSVNVGTAQEFYEIGEDADPERPVYWVKFDVAPEEDEESTVLLTSYGMTNLIKRVCSLRRAVIVNE